MEPGNFHSTALVESRAIGRGTRVWAYAHILAGAQIGNNCNVGDHAFIESGAVVGNNVTIKNHVCIWEGVTVEDDCFVGPHVVFTNDVFPRSPRMEQVRHRYERREHWLKPTVVERGCSIGANCTILPGVRLGAYSMIAAGATVTRDVKPHALMMGVPARQVGVVCRCGQKIDSQVDSSVISHKPLSCSACGFLVSELAADYG